MKSTGVTAGVRPSVAASVAITVSVTIQQPRWTIDKKKLAEAVQAVLTGEKCNRAGISVAVVDDPTIHKMNQEFLQHNEPTDVLSFLLESVDDYLEGEIIVSADTAVRTAKRYGWTYSDELLLYVIHGALHLLGYDDRSPAARRKMRDRERYYLNHFRLQPRYKEVST
jgi:probable rRNA maturation factor